ncbi:MAG: MOSC domain-containing protein [Acidobacteria bacterium]|nr:MOSC domain-containing protein [Acidobacteriota bacterium]
MGLVVSIQIGKVRQLGTEGAANPMDQPWTTATIKEPVSEPVWLATLGFAGDEHADGRYHGGPDKAVLVYSEDHSEAWRQEVFKNPLPPGAFGENILVSGMTETDVCIGDVYWLGEVMVAVSQPRQPCWKQARRWRLPELTARMTKTGRTGWYLRVLREGHVQAGERFALAERPHPEWTVARAHVVMHYMKKDRESTAALAGVAALSEAWKQELRKRLPQA